MILNIRMDYEYRSVQPETKKMLRICFRI